MKKYIALFLGLIILITSVFSGCSNELDLNNDSIKYKIENGEATVKELPDKSNLTEITIPDEYENCPVTVIADFAAANLENVTVINIGKNVKEIGGWAFENDQKLTSFNVAKDNLYFCDVDGVLYTKDMKTLLFYPPSRDITVSKNSKGSEIMSISYVIPDSVEAIRTKAFYKCQFLKSLTLPKNLKIIEEKAFFRCSALIIDALPEGLTLIAKDAFGYCTSLTELIIPASVKQIDEYAFYNCTSLLKIDIDKAENEITLGKKWYPTNNGLEIDELIVTWKE